MMEGKQVRRLLFLAFFLSLFLMVARLLLPFLTIILWSGLIYAFLAPLHARLSTGKDGKDFKEPWRSIIAGAFALGGVLIVVLPLVFLASAMVGQIGDFAQALIHAVDSRPELFDLSPEGPVGGLITRLSGGAIDLSSIDLRGELYAFLKGSVNSIISLSGALLKNAANLVITLAFMVFTLYFFFADGRHLVEVLIGAMPIERSLTTLFLIKLRDTSRQLVMGYFLVAIGQATMAFILFSIFRIHGPLILAALTAVASFVPMVGTGLVWFPVSLARILGGDTASGIVLMTLSAIFISTADNFVRPLLLQERLKIHPLPIFFSIVGGLQVFGFNGLILGPLILILFFTGVSLYDKVYTREPEEPESQEERAVEAEPDQAERRDPESPEA